MVKKNVQMIAEKAKKFDVKLSVFFQKYWN